MLAENFEVSRLAIPAVSVLISFLAYTSQYFFHNFKPAPLTLDEGWALNVFALCIWVCYYRACFVDPGRLDLKGKSVAPSRQEKDQSTGRQRWCRRCEAYKPPRAHHYGSPLSMDFKLRLILHIPHFFRFLFYTVLGMGYLETLLWQRASIIWHERDMPSYLGPSVAQLVHLLLLIVVNSVTWLGLFILLVRTIGTILFNTTTIESWEIERHETLVRRARVLGGSLEGPGGVNIVIRKQEFPYDIGIFSNIVQAMGGYTQRDWFWPFAASPDRNSGWTFKTNGFEDASVTWPPPDPDRIPIPKGSYSVNDPEIPLSYASARDQVEAFDRRQAADSDRLRPYSTVQRRKRFHERFQDEPNYDSDEDQPAGPTYGNDSDEGEESWRNSEGERLGDFGVDEDVEFYDEDDIPLGVLVEQRRGRQ
ncbi:Palmitoyltransferase pfa4 [Penicillium cosmopolitanum]|uniref:Palmitoyltransferase pfa4 n=1 Tax=Penicillium cosmopolitanum TaxID=1131564 RepID=A0A9W9W6R4_9EURO|nr:Palmitoyltransferase pfa4 [Penicillium cosmopolitanum]KAJ5404346.1 Palmitoyltransferase pfa4 [Penicillium cosmopolitanum]